MTASEINVQKLDAPRNLPDAIARDALFARGLDDPSVQLVLLQAPAGHGKTTTLLQFKERAERDGARTAWLTFDNADNDTRRFSVHLQAVIDRVAPVDAREADTAQHDALIPRRASDWLIDRLMQSREPIALFFDEFQQLQQPDLLGFCQEWFERLPMHVRVYIGTRAEPAIHLSRMIVSRRAVVLRTEDLRFTRDEVSRYFDAQLGTEVTRDEVDSIFRLTEGWPVAVQLYGLSLSSADVRRTLHLPPPQTQELARYLSSRVLMLQEPDGDGWQELMLMNANGSNDTTFSSDGLQVTGDAHVKLRIQDLEAVLGGTDLPADAGAELAQVELPGEQGLVAVVVHPLGQVAVGPAGVLHRAAAVPLLLGLTWWSIRPGPGSTRRWRRSSPRILTTSWWSGRAGAARRCRWRRWRRWCPGRF